MNQKKKEKKKEGRSGFTDNIPPTPTSTSISSTRSLPQPPTAPDGAEAKDPAGWVLGIGSQGDPLGCTKVIEPLLIFLSQPFKYSIVRCTISAPIQSALGSEVCGHDLYRGKGTHIGYFLTEVLIAWIWGLGLEDHQETKCGPECFSKSSEPLRISRAQGRLFLGQVPRLKWKKRKGLEGRGHRRLESVCLLGPLQAMVPANIYHLTHRWDDRFRTTQTPQPHLQDDVTSVGNSGLRFLAAGIISYLCLSRNAKSVFGIFATAF